jgi:hypothetical protein
MPDVAVYLHDTGAAQGAARNRVVGGRAASLTAALFNTAPALVIRFAW